MFLLFIAEIADLTRYIAELNAITEEIEATATKEIGITVAKDR